MGRPFHPQTAELRVAPSPRLATGVSFLFRCPPSPAVPLGTMHPAMREELPQETPVARPPTRVNSYSNACGHKPVVVPDAPVREGLANWWEPLVTYSLSGTLTGSNCLSSFSASLSINVVRFPSGTMIFALFITDWIASSFLNTTALSLK